MTKRLMVLLVVAGMAVAVMAVPAGAAPADGNGNGFVSVFDFPDIPIPCIDGDELVLDVVGWEKGKEFKGNGNRNVGLTVFHMVFTFTNPLSEDTFVYRDVGPDRVYVDADGNFVLNTSGRPANAGGQGFSLNGHMVMTFDGDWNVIDLVWYGNEGPTDVELACAAIG
jgi:hypothetical protein